MLKIGDLVEIILCDKSIRIKNKYKGMVQEIITVKVDSYGNPIYRVRDTGLFFYEQELKQSKITNKYKYVRSG